MPAMDLPASANDYDEQPVPALLHEAQRLFDLGCSAIRSDTYDEAAEHLSRALEIRVEHYGELAPEVASTYYKYGCALLYKVQSESDPFVETEASTGRHQEASLPEGSQQLANGDLEDDDEIENMPGEVEQAEVNDGGEEEEGDLELAWKMLDIARVIYAKEPQRTLAEVDVITTLADVSLERELFQACFEDYETALLTLEDIVEADNRRIAELCFKIALAKQMDQKPLEALRYCKRAVSICEQRAARLSKELVEVKVPKGDAPRPTEEGFDKMLNEEDSLEGLGDVGNADLHKGSISSSEVEVKEEVKNLQELLVDLREKVEELQQMGAAPTLLDAFKTANPEAAVVMQQVYSFSTGVSTSSTGGSDPSLAASSSEAPVTNLGVMGRGVKRPMQTAVTGEELSHPDVQARKKSPNDALNGGSSG